MLKAAEDEAARRQAEQAQDAAEEKSAAEEALKSWALTQEAAAARAMEQQVAIRIVEEADRVAGEEIARRSTAELGARKAARDLINAAEEDSARSAAQLAVQQRIARDEAGVQHAGREHAAKGESIRAAQDELLAKTAEERSELKKWLRRAAEKAEKGVQYCADGTSNLLPAGATESIEEEQTRIAIEEHTGKIALTRWTNRKLSGGWNSWRLATKRTVCASAAPPSPSRLSSQLSETSVEHEHAWQTAVVQKIESAKAAEDEAARQQAVQAAGLQAAARIQTAAEEAAKV